MSICVCRSCEENCVPSIITTREEVSWTKTYCDYPASLWQLNYYFRGPGTGFNAAWATEVTADADNPDKFAITVPAAKTDDVTVAGVYTWQAWLTETADTTNKIKIGEGRTRFVLGFDPASVATVETRSNAQIALDTIDAALLAFSTSDITEYEIETPAGRRRVKRSDKSNLLSMRKHWAVIVGAEKTRERLRNGGSLMQSIPIVVRES